MDTRTIETVISSTCEPEYVSQSQAEPQETWIRNYFDGMGNCRAPTVPMDMYYDGTLAIAKKTSPIKRSRYIGVRHHYI